jgi:hypothetical protein
MIEASFVGEHAASGAQRPDSHQDIGRIVLNVMLSGAEGQLLRISDPEAPRIELREPKPMVELRTTATQVSQVALAVRAYRKSGAVLSLARNTMSELQIQ